MWKHLALTRQSHHKPPYRAGTGMGKSSWKYTDKLKHQNHGKASSLRVSFTDCPNISPLFKIRSEESGAHDHFLYHFVLVRVVAHIIARRVVFLAQICLALPFLATPSYTSRSLFKSCTKLHLYSFISITRPNGGFTLRY